MTHEEHLKALNEKRQRVWHEAKHVLDDAAERGRDLDAEDRQKWQRLNDQIDDLDVEIRELSERADRESRSAATRDAFERRIGAGNVDRQAAEERDTIRRFIHGDPTAGEPDPDDMSRRVLRVPVGRARHELDLRRLGADPIEARALAWDTGSIASGVPTLMARSLYEYLEASLALWRMPTTKFPTETGANIDYPTLAAHSIGTQVSGQGTALAGTDPTFSKTAFGAFKYGELVAVANEVIQDAAFPIEEFLGRDMGRALGRVIGTDLAVGSGSGKPRGVMTAVAGGGAGSVTTGGSLIDPTFETLIDGVYLVNDSYRNQNTAWLMRDATGGTIRKIRDGAGGTEGAFIWQPSQTVGMAGGQPDRLLGFGAYTDPNVASLASNARIIAFGDFSAYYIRHVGDILIERDTSVYFDKDQTALRAKWRVDGDLLDVNAIVSVVRNV